MCGIWAIFGSDDSVAEHAYHVHKIGHRGPDAFRIENINHYKNCCLGFHRLAIVDDMTGMQPIHLTTFPHLRLVYNGEIYNHKIVEKQFNFKYQTAGDGESILHLYAHGGIELAAAHLDGVFAFILLDVEKKMVFLGRDTYGVRPAFTVYSESTGFLAVCSEAKGLTYLLNNHGHKIAPLKPGHYEAYSLQDNGKVKLTERKQFHKIGNYPRYKTLAPTRVDDMYTNIRNLLTAAVRKRLMSHRRIGCMLSGGLDSSLIAALVTQLAQETNYPYPIQTFATGMEGATDLEAAQKVADHIDSEHHTVLFTADEGVSILKEMIYHLESYDITTIRASVGMYLISKYISSKTDSIVIFSGEGSDEVAQGYIYFHKAPTAEEADTDCHRLLNDLFYFDVLRADRTTAAHGLELRVPFLDHEFTAYYLSLPQEARQPQDGAEKYLIRKAFAGTGLVPDEILWRPKEAFSDGVSSQKKPWFKLLQEHLETQVSDDELAAAHRLYTHNTPQTKEALYYRRCFEERFAGHGSWIPYYWMPRWTTSNDPSARTLAHYAEEHEKQELKQRVQNEISAHQGRGDGIWRPEEISLLVPRTIDPLPV